MRVFGEERPHNNNKNQWKYKYYHKYHYYDNEKLLWEVVENNGIVAKVLRWAAREFPLELIKLASTCYT